MHFAEISDLLRSSVFVSTISFICFGLITYIFLARLVNLTMIVFDLPCNQWRTDIFSSDVYADLATHVDNYFGGMYMFTLVY